MAIDQMNHTVGRRRFCSSFLFGALVVPVMWLNPVGIACAEITDEALLFSAATAQRAEQIMKDIQSNTLPSTEVNVRTIPSLPSNDSDPKTLSVRMFGETRTRGLLVLIVKNPPRVVFTAGEALLKKIPDSDAIRAEMLESVTQEQYDKGLLSGLGALREKLRTAMPKAAAPESMAKDGISKLGSLWAGKRKEASEAEEPGSSTVSEVNAKKGFHIPTGFFYLMFAVIALLMLPRDRVLRLVQGRGVRELLAEGQKRMRALLPRKGR